MTTDPLGIALDRTAELVLGQPYEFRDETIHRTWIIHPVLLTLSEQAVITLDREHVDYRWVAPAEIGQYACVPHLDRGLRAVLP